MSPASNPPGAASSSPQPSPFEALLAELCELVLPAEPIAGDRVPAYVAVVLRGALLEVLSHRGGIAEAYADLRAEAQRSEYHASIVAFCERMLSTEGRALVEDVAARTRQPLLTTLGGIAVLGETRKLGGEAADQVLLVAVTAFALGVALVLAHADRAYAERLLERAHVAEGFADLEPAPPGQPETLDPERQAIATELLRALLDYGTVPRDDAVDALRAQYASAVLALPVGTRLALLELLQDGVEERRLSGNALMPFLHVDPSPVVVSSAALVLAQVFEAPDGDPLAGAREVIALARYYVGVRDPERAAGLLTGLLLTGDRRVLGEVGPCWRWLPSPGQRTLASMRLPYVHAGTVDWLLDWLEDSEGREFGLVAGTLSWMALHADGRRVADIARIMPVFLAEGRPVVQVLQEWSLEDYAEAIRPRLLQLAADESVPRVMNQVLKDWGINHTRRRKAGVHMRPPIERVAARPLAPLLRATRRAGTGLGDFVPLADADFMAHDGYLLLSWAIFNPFGPTWTSVGLLPTEDPDGDLLFYRMLNPFQQAAGVVGRVQGGARTDAGALAELIGELFARNTIGQVGDSDIVMLRDGVPTAVIPNWGAPAFVAAVPGMLLRSGQLRRIDVARTVEELGTSPWERVSFEEVFRATFDPANAPPRRGAAAVLPASDALLHEWLQRATEPGHLQRELLCLEDAWHGAIDFAPPAVSSSAFTFWQLDDFLSRYGFPVFRKLAEWLEPQGA